MQFRKKKMISLLLVLTMLLGMVPTVAAIGGGTFADTQGHWAEAAAETWNERKVMQGYAGNFRPAASITRAEVAQVMVNLLRLSREGKNTFEDVPADAWYTSAVLKCAQAGLMLGDGTSFRPDAPISRQEVMTVLARALNLREREKELAGYPDGGEVALWAESAVKTLLAMDAVHGRDGGLLAPQADISRAEVVTLLDNLISMYIDKKGTYTMSAKKTSGIVLVVAADVTLTGTVSGSVLVAGAAKGGVVTLKDLTVPEVTVGAAETKLKVTGKSKVDTLTVCQGTTGVKVEIAPDAKVGQVEAPEDTQVVKEAERDSSDKDSSGGEDPVSTPAPDTSPTPSPSPSQTPEPEGLTDFRPVADTFIEKNSASTSHNGGGELTVKYSNNERNDILLTFDLAGCVSEVTSATLRLNTKSANTNNGATRGGFVRLAVEEATGAADVENATWTEAGAWGYEVVAQEDINAVPGNTCDVDLTEYVRSKLEAGEEHFTLRLSSKRTWATFHSTESGKGPQLLLNLYGPQDESGHELWLRYHADQVPAAKKASYVAAIQELVTDVSEPAGMLKSAVEELRMGVEGLLGTELKRGTAVAADGAVVLAKKDSALLAGVDLDLSALGNEGYAIKTAVVNGHNATVIAANSDNGLLYGAFKLLSLMQTGEDISALDLTDKPVNNYRLLNHWDNPDLSIERGYAGLSLWDWATLPDVSDPVYREYARANASIGINGIVLNNVNAKADMITAPYLTKIAALADLMDDYGIKLYISLNFGSSKSLGGIGSGADNWDRLQPWWTEKFTEIHTAVPQLGGFLIKADSEGQAGPSDYGKGHVDGANMLGDALKASDFGDDAVIMWRAFVYGEGATGDRATQAYRAFKDLDGQFRDNVIIQIKNGPLDFQTHEPVHPLFGALPNTNIAMEFQITQEYTGQDLHNCYLVPQWKEILDFDTHCSATDSTVADLIANQSRSVVAGVANTAGMENWTGLQLSQANWYGFGRLAWDPGAAEADITEDWAAMTFGCDPDVVETVSEIMEGSWPLYESYTSPLGLHFVTDGQHLQPNISGRQSYHKADATGIGFERSNYPVENKDYTDMLVATNNYFPENRDLFDDPETCPDQYLLWFHHLAWDDKLKDGNTLYAALRKSFSGGEAGVQAVIEKWETLEGKIDARRYNEILSAFEAQRASAVKWAEAWLPYIQDLAAQGMDLPQVPGELNAEKHAPADAVVVDGALVLNAGESAEFWATTVWGAYDVSVTGAGEGTVEISLDGQVLTTVDMGAEKKVWTAEQTVKLSSVPNTGTLTLKATGGTVKIESIMFADAENTQLQNWALASKGGSAECVQYDKIFSGSKTEGSAANLINGERTYINNNRFRYKGGETASDHSGEAVLELTLPTKVEVDCVGIFSQQNDKAVTNAPGRTENTAWCIPGAKITYYDEKTGGWEALGALAQGSSKVWDGVFAPAGTVTDKIRVAVSPHQDNWCRVIEIEVWGKLPEGTDLFDLTVSGDGEITAQDNIAASGKTASLAPYTSVTLKTEGNPRAFQGWEVTQAPQGFALTEEQKSSMEITFTMPEGDVALTPRYIGENWALESKGATATGTFEEVLNASDGKSGSKVEGDPMGVIDGRRNLDGNNSAATRWRYRSTSKPEDANASQGSATVELTLAQTVEVYTVSVFSQQADGSGYPEPTRDETSKFALKGAEVSYWDNDNSQWKPLGGIPSDSNKVWNDIYAEEGVVTDKLRLQMYPTPDNWARLIELEVWGVEPEAGTIQSQDVEDTIVLPGKSLPVVLSASATNGKSVTWTAVSADEDVATAEVTDGLLTVTGVAAGTVEITLTARATLCADEVKTFTVTVAQPLDPAGFTVDVSSTEKSNTREKAIDGDMGTRWAASTSDMPQWLKLDLGDTYTLDQVTIEWFKSGDRAYWYTLSVSMDGENYTQVVDRSANTQPCCVSDLLGGVEARYLKVDVSGRTTEKGAASIYEILLVGTLGG